MGKWGMSDDEEEEEEEEVVEQQQPLVEEVQAEIDQPVYDEEEPVTSAPATFDKIPIGYARGIKYSMSEKDFGKFLNESNVGFERIEYEFDDSKFTGKAKVFLADAASLENFLKLDEYETNGVTLRTKVWEPTFNKKQNRGGRGSGYGGRGDKFDRPGRGGRDNNDRRSSRRPAGSGDARNFSGDSEFKPRDSSSFRSNNSLGKSRDEKDNTSPLPSPATRPRLNLQPRTLPIETIGKLPPSPSSSSIFGTGKAQNLTDYEKTHKEVESGAAVPPVPPTEELEKLSVTVSNEEVAAAPNTSSSTNSNKPSNNRHNKKDKKDKAPSSSSPVNTTNNNNNNKEHKNNKKHKDSKDNKEKDKKKEVVDEVPSDFTVIGSKNKTAAVPSKTSPTNNATTTTKPVAKSATNKNNAFSGLLSDSEEDSD